MRKPTKPRKLKQVIGSEQQFNFRVPEKTRQYYKKLFTPPSDTSEDGIIQWLYNRGLVQNYIKKLEYETIDDETIQDEIQEIWLMLIEKKAYLKQLYDTQGITGLTAVVSGIIHRQVHSNTSTIYNKYKANFKRLIHLSDTCWADYYNTGKMMDTNTDYLTSETDDDIIKRNIENDLYE